MDSSYPNMLSIKVERSHWLNTLLGIIDSVWILTPTEQVQSAKVLLSILDTLNIPDRGNPSAFPIQLALEVESGYYTILLAAEDESGYPRVPKVSQEDEYNFPIEVWTASLVSILVVAYPELEPVERVYASKCFMDLLDALNISNRNPTHVPSSVTSTPL